MTFAAETLRALLIAAAYLAITVICLALPLLAARFDREETDA